MDFFGALEARSPHKALAETLRETIEEFELTTLQHREDSLSLEQEHKAELAHARETLLELHRQQLLSIEHERDLLLAELSATRSAQSPKRVPGGSGLWDKGLLIGGTQPLLMEQQMVLAQAEQLRTEVGELTQALQSQQQQLESAEDLLHTAHFELDELRTQHEEVSLKVASDSEQLQQLTKENTALKGDAGYQAEIAQQRAGRLKLRAHRRMVNRATSDCVMAWRQRTKEEVVKQRAQRSLKRAAKRMVHRGLSDGVLSWKWNYQVALVQRHQQSEKEALEGVHARRMAGLRRSSINQLDASNEALQQTQALLTGHQDALGESRALAQLLDDALLKWQMSTLDAAGASTMFDSIDQNSDGVIDSSEFQEWRIKGPQPDRETVIKEWSAWSSDAVDKCRQWDEAVEYAATLTNRTTPVSLLPLLQRLAKEADSSKARCADYKAQLLDAQAAAEKQQATEEALEEEQQRREQGSHAYSLQQIQLQNARRGIESLQQQLRRGALRRVGRTLQLRSESSALHSWRVQLLQRNALEQWMMVALNNLVGSEAPAPISDSQLLEPAVTQWATKFQQGDHNHPPVDSKAGRVASLAAAPDEAPTLETERRARLAVEAELQKATELLKMAQTKIDQDNETARRILDELKHSEEEREQLERQLAILDPQAQQQGHLGVQPTSPAGVQGHKRSPVVSPTSPSMLQHVGIHQYIACAAVSEPSYSTLQSKLRNAQDLNNPKSNPLARMPIRR